MIVNFRRSIIVAELWRPEVARHSKHHLLVVLSKNDPLRGNLLIFSERIHRDTMNEQTRREAFEMKGLRKILHVSWTAKKTNEWVLNKAGVKRELIDTFKARKLAYYGHTMRKQGNCME